MVKESLDRVCYLVWQGVKEKRVFDKWKTVNIKSENEARKLLGDKGMEHLWNQVMSFQPDRAIGETLDDVNKELT